MRRRLTTTMYLKFEEFFVPFTTSLSLNWPYPDEHVLTRTSSEDGTAADGDVRLSPTFDAHLRDLRNWSVGAGFQDSFPELVDDGVVIRG